MRGYTPVTPDDAHDLAVIFENEALKLQAQRITHANASDVHEFNSFVSLLYNQAILIRKRIGKGAEQDVTGIRFVEEQLAAYKRGGLDEVRRVRRDHRKRLL